MNNKFFRFLNKLLATGFFIGKIPGAPGTYGSLLAILMLILFPVLKEWYFVLPISLLGIIICNNEEVSTGIEDAPSVVIDEMAGIFLTFMSFEINPLIVLIGFILFRLFDIWKPYIIDDVQKLSGGIGVMADDILAGIISHFILRIFLILI